MIDKRIMYAMGQRVGGIMGSNNGSMLVTPTRDGSRPGYYGPDAGHENDPGHGSNAPGGGGGGGGDGGSTNREKGIMSQYSGPKGTTGNINDFDDRGGVDRSAVGQFSTYGKNVMNQNLKGPGLFSRIGDGIGDYIKGGGLLGMGIRGLTGLFDKFTGPKATEYGNLNIPGYNMLNIAGPKEYDFGSKGGDGEDSNLYATTNQYPIIPVVSEENEGIETLVNNPDFVHNYRGLNRTRLDKQGQLDPEILEMISKLYT